MLLIIDKDNISIGNKSYKKKLDKYKKIRHLELTFLQYLEEEEILGEEKWIKKYIDNRSKHIFDYVKDNYLFNS